MKTRVLFVALLGLFLVAGMSALADDKPGTHEGTVVKVDKDKLTLTDKDGTNEHMHTVPKDAKVTRDGRHSAPAPRSYAAVRKEHPAIERKLAELVNRHDARHARYRGQPGVLWQMLMTGVVVNLKRIVRLLADGARLARPPGSAGTVRAELVGVG